MEAEKLLIRYAELKWHLTGCTAQGIKRAYSKPQTPRHNAHLILTSAADRNTHTARWVNSHLIQQNEIIQPVVKIINESHISYKSVTVWKQVVLVLHTQFTGRWRNYSFSLTGWGWGVVWRGLVGVLIQARSHIHIFISHKWSLIAWILICYKTHRAEIVFFFCIS